MLSPGSPAVMAAVAEGARRWPAVALTPEQLVAHLRQAGRAPIADISHGAELCLAAACAAGDPAAMAVFEAEYVARVPAYVSRLALGQDVLDDLRQRLRIRVLFDRPPRIGTYAGLGPLDGWVRLTAVRLALDLLETQKSLPCPIDPVVITSGLKGAEPCFDVARARYGPLFQTVLQEALEGLGDRDKALLRFHFVEQLNIEEIGRIYRIHRATAARWLLDIRRRLLAAVQHRLSLEVRITTSSEFRSLLDVVRDDLHLSISRILGQ
jgi:RNA polymerase sigma-70 factor (ECF subfamily)